MIVVDTSALMAVILGEAQAVRVAHALTTADVVAISAGTLAEALIVADRRGVGADMRMLIRELDLDVVPVTEAFAETVAAAHGRWGRGSGPAQLNFGDCFAYGLASLRGWPLLFVGEDFIRTDIRPAP
jgi:ribonuclease VapC